MIIGLNPPFGYRGKSAKRFVEHACREFRPEVLVLILPIMRWVPDGYVEESRRNLDSRSFYRGGTGGNGTEFEYPCIFVVYRRDPDRAKLIKRRLDETTKPVRGVTIKPHVVHVDKDHHTTLVVRRVGYYAGRTFYIVKNHEIWYIHKRNVQKGVSWTDNGHKIKNCFYVVTFEMDVSSAALVKFAHLTSDQMDAESDVPVRKKQRKGLERPADAKRTLSINTSMLHRYIRMFWAEAEMFNSLP